MERETLTSPAPFIHPLPPPPNPIQKIIKNPRRYFAEVWSPTSQNFRPRSDFVLFPCKIELFGTSENFVSGFSEVWPQSSQNLPPAFCRSLEPVLPRGSQRLCYWYCQRFFSECFSESLLPLRRNSCPIAAEPMSIARGNTHHISKTNQERYTR